MNTIVSKQQMITALVKGKSAKGYVLRSSVLKGMKLGNFKRGNAIKRGV